MIAVFALLGLCFGSFINAFVWRLRHKRDWVRERSECVDCHHELAWYDLIPVVSWLWLRGRCRYCRRAISPQYPIVETLTAVSFVVSYLFWPYGLETIWQWSYFGMWLVALVLLIALAVYDIRWFELPDSLTWSLAALTLVMALLKMTVLQLHSAADIGLQLALGLLPIAGLYGMLYVVSRRRWVGFGDVKLGVGLGWLLGWKLAAETVFLANTLGLVAILPGLLMGKLSRTSHIPFGPFLIAAGFVAFLWGEGLLDWYMRVLLNYY